ncbi:MAG: hypothetical protein JWM55_295 [Acidimicrobiaceae bacterium]|nr:hypothetical protein [Acidimicrobiaceae bacterium]
MAEELGYATLYVEDHIDSQFGPLVAATVAAESTATLNIGTLVLNNDLRNPVVLAQEIATLGLAAEGRIEFGLGAGWLRSDYESTGVDYDSPGARVSRLAESLTIMKSLWIHGVADFEGEHYVVRGAHCDPRPDVAPKVIVGGGSRRILSLAAQEADIVNVSRKMSSGTTGDDLSRGTTADHFDDCLGWIREAAGDRFESLELQIAPFAVMVVSSSRIAVRGATMLGFRQEGALDLPILLIGTEEELCERLLERRERWGFSNVVVPGESMEAFAPIVARLANQ